MKYVSIFVTLIIVTLFCNPLPAKPRQDTGVSPDGLRNPFPQEDVSFKFNADLIRKMHKSLTAGFSQDTADYSSEILVNEGDGFKPDGDKFVIRIHAKLQGVKFDDLEKDKQDKKIVLSSYLESGDIAFSQSQGVVCWKESTDGFNIGCQMDAPKLVSLFQFNDSTKSSDILKFAAQNSLQFSLKPAISPNPPDYVQSPLLRLECTNKSITNFCGDGLRLQFSKALTDLISKNELADTPKVSISIKDAFSKDTLSKIDARGISKVGTPMESIVRPNAAATAPHEETSAASTSETVAKTETNLKEGTDQTATESPALKLPQPAFPADDGCSLNAAATFNPMAVLFIVGTTLLLARRKNFRAP